MTVYVDDQRNRLGRMKMCHMAADSREELLAMADRIGVDRKWLQHPGEWQEHFDISLSKRELAVKAGAKEVTVDELVRLMRAKAEPKQPQARCPVCRAMLVNGKCPLAGLHNPGYKQTTLR